MSSSSDAGPAESPGEPIKYRVKWILPEYAVEPSEPIIVDKKLKLRDKEVVHFDAIAFLERAVLAANRVPAMITTARCLLTNIQPRFSSDSVMCHIGEGIEREKSPGWSMMSALKFTEELIGWFWGRVRKLKPVKELDRISPGNVCWVRIFTIAILHEPVDGDQELANLADLIKQHTNVCTTHMDPTFGNKQIDDLCAICLRRDSIKRALDILTRMATADD